MAYSLERIIKLVLFYLIFYSVLVAFSAAMFAIFLKTLDDREPRWKLDNSLIGSNPGMGMRSGSWGPLIEYKSGDTVNAQHWSKELNVFLSPYLEDEKKSQNVENCAPLQYPQENKVCDFKLTSNFAPCLPQYSYGLNYGANGPCVFLKINKIFGWIPEFYNRDTVPPDMPRDLVEKIKEAELKNEQNKIWVDCVSHNASETGIMGPLKYFPQQGFDGNYFPYTNIQGYLSPLVAVHFENPKHGVWILVECRAWAANIYRDRKANHGLIQFALFIQ